MSCTVETSDFGITPDGGQARLFTLKNSQGTIVRMSNHGATITELQVRDRAGNLADIVLGFDNLGPYLLNPHYFGCTVGRVANRIANATFRLEGQRYSVTRNHGEHHLHGGARGFDKVLWAASLLEGAGVKFSYTSPDGEEGYPGTLKVDLTMSLSDANELTLDYQATTDRTTIVNLTNHSYFNLAGEGDVLEHELMISAASYTPSRPDLIPTGEVAPVRGTPFDFTSSRKIGSRFGDLPGDARGYDTNYVVNRAGKGLALAARVFEPRSGRQMEVHTTQPGVQLYTGNFLDGTLIGKKGTAYPRYGGFCLETQHYPDSINHHDFPSIILRPAQTYHQITALKFSSR